jgi:hypothetical protein
MSKREKTDKKMEHCHCRKTNLVDLNGRDIYATREPVTVQVRGQTIHLPVGTLTNGPTFPPCWRWIAATLFGEDQIRKLFRGSLIHDYLYSTSGLGVITRNEADLIFFDLIRADGVCYPLRLGCAAGLVLGRPVIAYGKGWTTETNTQFTNYNLAENL